MVVKYLSEQSRAHAVRNFLDEKVSMTHRRQLITALGANVLAKGLAFTQGAVAQQPPAGAPGKVWRVGVVPGGPFAPRKYQWEVFFSQMQALGYLEGKNVQYEVRAPEKEGAPFDDLIAALLALNVGVIVTTGKRLQLLREMVPKTKRMGIL